MENASLSLQHTYFLTWSSKWITSLLHYYYSLLYPLTRYQHCRHGGGKSKRREQRKVGEGQRKGGNDWTCQQTQSSALACCIDLQNALQRARKVTLSLSTTMEPFTRLTKTLTRPFCENCHSCSSWESNIYMKALKRACWACASARKENSLSQAEWPTVKLEGTVARPQTKSSQTLLLCTKSSCLIFSPKRRLLRTWFGDCSSNLTQEKHLLSRNSIVCYSSE